MAVQSWPRGLPQGGSPACRLPGRDGFASPGLRGWGRPRQRHRHKQMQERRTCKVPLETGKRTEQRRRGPQGPGPPGVLLRQAGARAEGRGRWGRWAVAACVGQPLPLCSLSENSNNKDCLKTPVLFRREACGHSDQEAGRRMERAGASGRPRGQVPAPCFPLSSPGSSCGVPVTSRHGVATSSSIGPPGGRRGHCGYKGVVRSWTCTARGPVTGTPKAGQERLWTPTSL